MFLQDGVFEGHFLRAWVPRWSWASWEAAAVHLAEERVPGGVRSCIVLILNYRSEWLGKGYLTGDRFKLSKVEEMEGVLLLLKSNVGQLQLPSIWKFQAESALTNRWHAATPTTTMAIHI